MTHPPGPKGHFLLGSTLEFMRQPTLPLFQSLVETYGDVVFFRVGRSRKYLVTGADAVRDVFVTHANNFHRTRNGKRTAGRFIGNGLFVSDGDFHMRQRRLVQPSLHVQRLQNYMDVMIAHTHRHMDAWSAGDDVDMSREMAKLTLGIVTESLFSADVSAEADKVGPAINVILDAIKDAVKSPFPLPWWLPTPSHIRSKQAIAELDAILMPIIAAHRQAGDTGDLLSMLLLAVDEEGDGTGMTDRQARDEAVTLFIAGHESSANALSWLWAMLAKHPEVEARLLEGIDTVLGDRDITMADLKQLTYTEMVIKETLRMYPPAWIFARRSLEEVTVGGHTIEKDGTVIISPYLTQHRPDYFPDPETFNPERFAPGYEKSLPRFAYFPFGGGNNFCVGHGFAMMEMKVIVALLLQRYRFVMDPAQTITAKASTTLRPREGVPVRVTAREHAAEMV